MNHAMMNTPVMITDTIFAWHVQWTPSTMKINKYVFGYKNAMQDMLVGTCVGSYLQVSTSLYSIIVLIAVADSIPSVLSLVK